MWRYPSGVVLGFCCSTVSVAAHADTNAQATEILNSVQRTVGAYEQAMWQHRFGDALKYAEKLPVPTDSKQGKALVDAMRASALLGLRREAEARALIKDSYELAPEIPDPSSTILYGALTAGRYDVAADAIDRMIALFPDTVRYVDPDVMLDFIRNAPSAQERRNDDRKVALGRLRFGGDTAWGYFFSENAVEILVNRGDFKSASELLPQVKDPVALQGMLIQKRYSPLWQQIGQLAGPQFRTVNASAVLSLERAYTDAPDDGQALASYVDALRHAGRTDDAIALRSKLPSTRSGIVSANEKTGWALNSVAYALHDAGRKDEADKLFAFLNDAPMAVGNWRISTMINRVELLLADGQEYKALPLITSTLRVPGSNYAEQLLRGLRYCALSRLGRGGDAQRYKPDFLAHASDAPIDTIDGLLCGGDLEGAEKLALSELSNPDLDKRADFEKDFVRRLQSRPLIGDDPPVWQSRWTEFRQRPAIASAFSRLGRDMPAEFVSSAAASVPR